MKQVEKWQVKAIYALGSSLGIVQKGSHDDNLHLLIDSLCGKSRVSNLSFDEANKVINELKTRMTIGSLQPPPRKTKRHPTTANGMTDGQQRKVWHLMYELAALDEKRSKAVLGDRLCGIIKRQLNIDSTAKQPFQWLNYRQGGQLIEVLKKYVSSAQAKQVRGGADGLTRTD